MPYKKVKDKICKECKNNFKPYLTTQKVCSPKCAITYAQKQEIIKEAKRTRKAKTDFYDTHIPTLKKRLERIFNKYIRLRDGKICISCQEYKDDIQAGHYIAVGSSTNLRFNEFNVHGQCLSCNVYKAANKEQYTPNLIKKIGIEEYNKLKQGENLIRIYTVDELHGLIIKYRGKVRELERAC